MDWQTLLHGKMNLDINTVTKLVVWNQERQKAVRRHDQEDHTVVPACSNNHRCDFNAGNLVRVQIVPACCNNLRCEFNTGILVRDYLEIHRTCPAPGEILQTRSRSRRESSNEIEIETRIVKRDWDQDENRRTRSTREPLNVNTTERRWTCIWRDCDQVSNWSCDVYNL